MRGARPLIFSFALLCAIGAMWFMRSALESQARATAQVSQPAVAVEEKKEELPQTADVLVAANDVPVGRRLAPSDLRWQKWPAESVSSYFYTKADDPDAIEALEGSASRLTIREGEPISTDKVIDLNGAGMMASLLRKGMRAVSVPISDVTGAGGFILPGDFVDLLLTRQIEIEEVDPETGAIVSTLSHSQTETVMEHVRVVAIDQRINDEEKFASVGNTATLEVMAEQAELITLTRQIAKLERGFLTLSLRSFAEMVELFGDDLPDAMPKTVLDLHQLAKEKIERAKALRAEYEAERQRAALAAAATAERRLEEERLRAQTAAMLEAAALAKTQADAAAQPITSGPSGPVQLAAPVEEEEDNSVVLIRNGAPIVVQSILPSRSGGTQ